MRNRVRSDAVQHRVLRQPCRGPRTRPVDNSVDVDNWPELREMPAAPYRSVSTTQELSR